MTDCIFCKIAQGDFNTDFIYQDDQVLVFNDLHPKAKYHVLVIPREHIATLNDFDQSQTELLGHMMQTAAQVAKQLGIDESGYRVAMNCNRDGGQEVYHAHLHMLGGERLSWFR
ncbi:MAG: histidine triad nucleotide-binding protein [Coxiellaceae bacterium]|nr:histidine triad nucleotide-binding protein [Coxiellaceae bacterium]